MDVGGFIDFLCIFNLGLLAGEIGLIGINVMPSIQELPTPAAVKCFHHVFKRGGKQAPPFLFSAMIASILRLTKFAPTSSLLWYGHLGLVFALLPGWIGVFAAMGQSSRHLIAAYDNDTTDKVKPALESWNRINMVRVTIAVSAYGLLVWSKCAAS